MWFTDAKHFKTCHSFQNWVILKAIQSNWPSSLLGWFLVNVVDLGAIGAAISSSLGHAFLMCHSAAAGWHGIFEMAYFQLRVIEPHMRKHTNSSTFWILNMWVRSSSLRSPTPTPSSKYSFRFDIRWRVKPLMFAPCFVISVDAEVGWCTKQSWRCVRQLIPCVSWPKVLLAIHSSPHWVMPLYPGWQGLSSRTVALWWCGWCHVIQRSKVVRAQWSKIMWYDYCNQAFRSHQLCCFDQWHRTWLCLKLKSSGWTW